MLCGWITPAEMLIMQATAQTKYGNIVTSGIRLHIWNHLELLSQERGASGAKNRSRKVWVSIVSKRAQNRVHDGIDEFLSICISKMDVWILIQFPKARSWSEPGNARACRGLIYGWGARVTPLIDPWGRPNISKPSNKANNFYMTLAKIKQVSKMMLVT